MHRRDAGLGAALRSVVRRTYETRVAVDAVSFRIEAGERVALLGPNGAGKTTTLKMLSGLLHPTSGDVEVAGHVPHRRERDFLGRITLVMGQKQQLLWDLPPAETFDLNRALFDVPRARYDATLRELDELLQIGDVARKPTRQLSLGERMKCELAAALLHGPDVLFLDEPTIGLDVTMQLAVRSFLRADNERRGATLVLTSHAMADVVDLCPRVIVVDQGKIRYDGALSGLVRSIRPDKRVSVRLAGPAPADLVAKLGSVVVNDGARLVWNVRREDLRDVASTLLGASWADDLTVEDPPLDEVLRDMFDAAAPRRAP